MNVERRVVLRTLAQFAIAAVPLRHGLLASPRVEIQPLLSQVRRIVDAMRSLGEPFADADLARLTAAADSGNEPAILAAIENLLDTRCLADVRINPEGRVSIERGRADARLVEQGWRAFLVRVRNEAGVTGPIALESPQARPVYRPATGNSIAPVSVRPSDIADRWLALEMFDGRPMEPRLSGLELEYRIVSLYSRDRGTREALFGATTGVGSPDIGFRNRVAIVFQIDPSHDVTLRVRDEHGRPTVASFLVEDAAGRIYPARMKRLAPDFFFQPQVYREDGETLRLPPGDYTVTCGRGPEYAIDRRPLRLVADAAQAPLDFRLSRWIDPPALGWFSGDHHLHAAGCSHYESPTEGVRPEDMMRHVLGEALSVGAVLNWGPAYYHQRQYFEAKDNPLSTPSTLLRYDLEVSGFPSSHCGHLVLLRLRDQDYPDTRQIEDWPSWDLPILAWAKSQGAIGGFAHTGWGLEVSTHELPNYEMPPFDGIGANEYIVDVTHDVVDFISAIDTPVAFELNIWYHTLNCGYRTRIGGETDFPCISDERVGAGRSYVKLTGALSYDAWCEGLRSGRSYVSDGRAHLMDFAANGRDVGTGGSEIALDGASRIALTARAACLLPSEAPEEGVPAPDRHPYWTPERARIPGTRDVTVEAIVNGRVAHSQRLAADGSLRDVRFEVPVDRSSWIALRIPGSAHTNPIFVTVGGRPIRASRRSAEWCVAAVDQCWSQKESKIRKREREAASRAYDHARQRYRAILAESDAD
ncbi:MAG TPA: CehA/McbA family metallohydrolase [Vicinamibacterales bacterium]|nr:CehA/McbA family metallohydrolase [Vicinamibacterales bacterium]